MREGNVLITWRGLRTVIWFATGERRMYEHPAPFTHQALRWFYELYNFDYDPEKMIGVRKEQPGDNSVDNSVAQWISE